KIMRVEKRWVVRETATMMVLGFLVGCGGGSSGSGGSGGSGSGGSGGTTGGHGGRRASGMPSRMRSPLASPPPFQSGVTTARTRASTPPSTTPMQSPGAPMRRVHPTVKENEGSAVALGGHRRPLAADCTDFGLADGDAFCFDDPGAASYVVFCDAGQ